MKKGDIEYRYMCCYSSPEKPVMLTHSVLLYDRKNVDYAYVLLSVFDYGRIDSEQNQRNFIIRNKKLFSFYLNAYSQFFNSCKELDIDKFKSLYCETYESNMDKQNLIKNINEYFSKIDNNKDEIKMAEEFWLKKV